MSALLPDLERAFARNFTEHGELGAGGAPYLYFVAMNVPPGTLTPILLRDAAPESLARGQRWMEAIRRLARASELKPLTGEMPKGSAQS